MRSPHRGLLFPTLLVAAAALAGHPARGATPVLEAMKQELQRSVETLSKQPTPLYFLSYEVTGNRRFSVSASFGNVTGSSEGDYAVVDVDLRVGSPELDNTHAIRGDRSANFRRYAYQQAPLEDPEALRSILWRRTDQQYKAAVERLAKVRANVQVKVAEEDQAGDFSAEPAQKWLEEPLPLDFDRTVWEEKLRRYTAPFAGSGDIYSADATLSANVETRWYVNSEGSEIRTSQSFYRLMIMAYTKAEDGMELPRYESFFSFTAEGLPDDGEILETVEEMIVDLKALREAPLVDPYTGPAILSGRASGVFFHEILGHRVEGHRQKREEEGQTFKKMVNQKVLPETFSVIFDPTVRRRGEMDLVGAYRYDNEGVKARRVPVIEKGVLKNFLMSRTPIEGFSRSNGHGRKQAGLAAVARQSNLFVEVTRSHSREELKAMLIESLEREDKPFGLYFKDVQGGFTMTGRVRPNAFNVLPTLVYRIYADGREELVRGVDLIGTPLTSFSKIAAADDQFESFNGICGAESGGVPVSAVSPAVLVSQIEVQKKEKSPERLPILPPPWESP